MPTIADDHVALLGRLCGGQAAARGERLALLGALLGSTDGIWAPEVIRTISPLDAAATESALGSLKRAGVLTWDARGGGYRVPTPMRPAVTALYLLLQPTEPEELIQAQAVLFHISRSDAAAEERTLIGLCEILAEDVMQLGDLAGRPLEEQLRSAAMLERHVSDAEGLLRVVTSEAGAPNVVGRALDLVGELARGVAALLNRLAAHSADQIPRARGTHAPAELRDGARGAGLAQLADAIAMQAGRAPRNRALPDERILAMALRSVRDQVTPVDLPDAGELSRATMDEPDPDALERLRDALGSHEADLADLVGGAGSWEDAAVLHHGAVRLHETLISRGDAGLTPSGDVATAPGPGVACVSRVMLPVAA